MGDQSRLIWLLEQAAAEIRPCRFCGVVLYFVRMKDSGKLAPLTREAVNHFTDCPQYAKPPATKAAAAPAQASLLDVSPEPLG